MKNETKDLFQKVKDLTRTRTVKISAVRDEGGVLVTETKQVLERWKQYCSALYEHDFADERTQDWNSEDLEPDILRSEVELAMSSLKIGKSPGNDAIPAELIKSIGSAGINIITAICNSVWRTLASGLDRIRLCAAAQERFNY